MPYGAQGQEPYAASAAPGMETDTLPRSESDAPTKNEETPPSETNEVKRWCKIVQKDKRRWEKDFKRMKEDRRFAYGVQWPDQDMGEEDRYINNFVIGAVNQKVATYYARNPKAVFRRKPRRDFELWDGTREMLAQSVQAIAMSNMAMRAGLPMMPDMHAMAVLQDYNTGKQRKHQVEAIGDTLQMLYQWMIDQQEPEFKKQMKNLVRRVCTCGVGYLKLAFVRDYGSTIDLPLTVSDFAVRAKRVKQMLEKLSDGDFDESSPKMEELRATLEGMIYSTQSGEMQDVNEHILISYPKASSIIPDKNCTCLKDFVGAMHITEERILPMEFVNEYYELRGEHKITATNEVVTYDEGGEEFTIKNSPDDMGGEEDHKKLVCLWEITDKRTKTRFTVCNGWKEFIVKPEAVSPCTHRFWPVFALTFNDVETESGDGASIFPWSDVHLLRSTQKEYNRSREALRQHRKDNAPRKAARAGALNEKNKRDLKESEPHDVIEAIIPDNQTIGDVLMAIPTTPIADNMYSTEHLERDAELAVGMQQANIGPAQPNVTATVGSIAEQSRMTKASSNVDDLDDMLSDLAKAAGEILLKEMSPATVKRVVGPGAVWPDPQNREDFLNEIYLEVQAASSGRPNKGVEVANMRELLPLLMQLGANPEFLVKEVVTRWDDNLDLTQAFPLVPPGGGMSGQGPQPQPVQNPGQGQRQVPPRPNRPGVDNRPKQIGPARPMQ